jgi:hypothetical protein
MSAMGLKKKPVKKTSGESETAKAGIKIPVTKAKSATASKK